MLRFGMYYTAPLSRIAVVCHLHLLQSWSGQNDQTLTTSFYHVYLHLIFTEPKYFSQHQIHWKESTIVSSQCLIHFIFLSTIA